MSYESIIEQAYNDLINDSIQAGEAETNTPNYAIGHINMMIEQQLDIENPNHWGTIAWHINAYRRAMQQEAIPTPPEPQTETATPQQVRCLATGETEMEIAEIDMVLYQ